MLRVRLSALSRPHAIRTIHTSAIRLREPPKPPRPIEDSTSALEYKSKRGRRSPPPLPATDLPRERTAEEAVTNILYNTPPPSLQPYKKHVLNCLVQNEPGVLSRLSGTLAGRGFNIDSLVVCSTEVKDLSRMCIVINGQDGVIEQARRQLEDLVPVWAVLDYTETRTIARELLLVKVSILGPEYLEEQLQGGQHYAPRQTDTTSFEQEIAIARHFEHSGEPNSDAPDQASNGPLPLTPSQVLAKKHSMMDNIAMLSAQFGGKIVDVSTNSVIIEMTGKTTRVDAFLALLKPFGVLESARTGLMVMPRTPIQDLEVQSEATETTASPDASLLPPG